MDILSYKIREDLRKHNRSMRAHWTARWRWLQLLVLICGLLIAFYSLLPPSWPLQQAVYLLLFAPLLILTGLQPFIQVSTRRYLVIGLISFIYIVLTLAAAVLNPADQASVLFLPSWAIWLSLAFPILSWSILFRLFHTSPAQSRQYSLRAKPILANAVIGAGVGMAAVLHFYLIAYFIPGFQIPPFLSSGEHLLWSFCVLAGLVVPAEELVFRGAGFSILYDELNYRFSDAVVRITAINLLVYLVIIASRQAVEPFTLFSLVYRAGLSAVSLYLVLRRRSLLPCILANLIFSLATGWLFTV